VPKSDAPGSGQIRGVLAALGRPVFADGHRRYRRPVNALMLHLFVFTVAGWISSGQQDLLDDLREENRVLREQPRGRRLQLTDDQRRRLAISFERNLRVCSSTVMEDVDGLGAWVGAELLSHEPRQTIERQMQVRWRRRSSLANASWQPSPARDRRQRGAKQLRAIAEYAQHMASGRNQLPRHIVLPG
jgi:hypothetical protein